jgi:hypothetical protein
MPSPNYKGFRPRLKVDSIIKKISEIQNDELRQCIACLIWWDLIGIHPRSEFPEYLHEFFEPYLNMRPIAAPPYEEIVKGLMWMGYLKRYALKRALDDVTHDRKTRRAKKIMRAIKDMTATRDLSLSEIAHELVRRNIKTVNLKEQWRPSVVQVFLKKYGSEFRKEQKE